MKVRTIPNLHGKSKNTLGYSMDTLSIIAKKVGLDVSLDGEIGPSYFGSVDEGYRKFAKVLIGECTGIYARIDNGNNHLGTDDYLKAIYLHFKDSGMWRDENVSSDS